MSTIVTRKSLALGAIVALATTVFAGTPAHAAGEINLAPSAGTSLATLSTEAFVLESTFAPGVTNQNSQLWFQIKTSTNVSVDVQADSLDASDVSDSNVTTAAAGTAADSADTTTFVRYVKANGASSTDRNFLGLKLKGATSLDSADVVVTAFVDSTNDHKLTAGEWSTSKTVSFKTYASVGAVVTLDQPNAGDTSAVGHVTLPGVNLSQVQHAVTLVFQKHSTDALDGTGGTAAKAGLTALSTDAGDYKATTATTLRAFTSADVIDLIGKFNGVVVGSTASKTVTDRTISKFEATVDVTDNGLANGTVRLNSSYTTTAVAYSNATTPAPLAGVAVTATVTSSVTSFATTAGSEQSVTVNGTKYSTYADLTAAKIALTTDANGKATVTVVPANFADTNTITVTFAAQNLTKAVTATQTAAVLTVADAKSAAVRAIAKNASATLNYTVKDQFGVSATATNLRLKVTSALATQYVPVNAGAAAVVVTPTTDSTDAVVAHVVLQASAIGTDQGVTWTNVSTAVNASDITVNVKSVADSFTTAPALTKVNNQNTDLTVKQTIENKAYSATDFPVVAGTTLAQIDGAAATNGADVTVSGAGLAFVVGGKVYTDTVTFPAAGGSGAFTVYVAGHKAGKATVTFVTGSVTKTVDVTFAAAVVSSLKNTVVAAPTQAQAGRAVNVTATITDAYGNPIANKTVKFAVDGVGTLSSSDAVTDDKGVATVRLVSSYGEDGDATVTVSHNGGDGVADTSATTTPDDFTLVKTVTFGITDASIDNVGKRVTAVASYSKGKTVGFYVDGVKKWSKVSTSDADIVVNYNLKKGRHTVTVKISGGLVTSEVIIVQ